MQGQFLSPAAESAMKLALPIRDTPLSVTSTLADLSVVPGAPRNVTVSLRIPF